MQHHDNYIMVQNINCHTSADRSVHMAYNTWQTSAMVIQGPKVRVCPEDMLRILVAIIDLNIPIRDYRNNHIDGLFAGVLP